MDNLAALRKSYSLGGLLENDLTTNPIENFRVWLQLAVDQAPDWFEPTAMTLATAGQTGDVSARIVLLKSLDNDCFTFFTNYDSQKGEQLAVNDSAALLFFWPYLERQVRVEGTVRKTTRNVSIQYFQSRPRGSQISAAVSAQSKVITNRKELETKAEQLAQQLGNDEVPCPENWGGYLLSPRRIEFWQGREDRLHDRLVFTRASNMAWTLSRLSP